MANSKYEYVRAFEQPDAVIPNTWIVVRIDGRGFSKLTAKYKFVKPNDRRALDLMNSAAEAVMKELPDLVLAYGNSDEFSFVFHKDCVLFERRASKLTTTIVSTFTSHYTFLWPTYFPDDPLTPPLPTFDGRAVCYPSDQNLRDYMSWRQVDCHINNLYNTTFWALVQQGGMEARAAEIELSGTVSSDKNEILFSRFHLNYNDEPEIFKKGSVLYRDFFLAEQAPPALAPARQSSVPISHPQPQRSIPRPMSQPIERTMPDMLSESAASGLSTPRGPTFLSTSTTPSPPPSPPSMSLSASIFPPGYENESRHVYTPSGSSTITKQHLPSNLIPLPLPPPTLKPSTKPPPSLSPPNPTAHTNTSPQPSPIAPAIIEGFTASNVADAAPTAEPSVSNVRPNTSSASTSKPALKKRSPSLSLLDSQNPPIIPLRISSIPLNNKPRKLSIQSQKSLGMLRNAEDKENQLAASTKPTAMSTMKELPSPPSGRDNEQQQQGQALSLRTAGSQGQWNELQTPTEVHPQDAFLASPSPPARHPARRTRSHSHTRIQSAPLTSYSFPSPPSHAQRSDFIFTSPSTTNSTASASSSSKTNPRDIAPTQQQTSKSKSKSKARNSENVKQGSKIKEEGGWAAGTREMSKTQREKERKKKTKARIVCEHVDIIKDEFWVKRPWILSGRAG